MGGEPLCPRDSTRAAGGLVRRRAERSWLPRRLAACAFLAQKRASASPMTALWWIVRDEEEAGPRPRRAPSARLRWDSPASKRPRRQPGKSRGSGHSLRDRFLRSESEGRLGALRARTVKWEVDTTATFPTTRSASASCQLGRGRLVAVSLGTRADRHGGFDSGAQAIAMRFFDNACRDDAGDPEGAPTWPVFDPDSRSGPTDPPRSTAAPDGWFGRSGWARCGRLYPNVWRCRS